MSEKQVYDLTVEDLLLHPVWYFPMDDSVEDELTIRPLNTDEVFEDYQIIVKTMFTDNEGKKYLGYIYWSVPSNIEDIKPVLFVNNEIYITFWNGIIRPSWEKYNSEQQNIRYHFPIKYCSVLTANLPVISGALEGLYFIDDNGDINCI